MTNLLSELRAILPQAAGRLSADVPMADCSTFRIGGCADVYFEPACREEIALAVRFCRERSVPVTVLGNGSNILVADRGIRGLTLVIGEPFSAVRLRGRALVAEAGARLSSLAAFAARHGLSGLEFASGIPGTLGGAIQMNAGAYDHCMAEVVALTEYLDEQLEEKALVGPEHRFAYRRSFFSGRSDIILRACIELKEDDQEAILGHMADYAQRRRASQPLELPSAGSAFKRPPGNYAGKLISDCGLKGCRIGNAQVSEKHAGFIVNLGGANAGDTRRLFEHVRQTVADRTGVELEPEVRFIGDWQDWEDTGRQTDSLEQEVI